MKPLYLTGRPGMEVDFEVPALRVSLPGQARQLFPLGRVSRVIVSGHVHWSMDALLACADAGVTVVFLHRDGKLRARWLGNDRIKFNLLQHLVDFLKRADAPVHYHNWLKGMKRMVARSTARRLVFSDWQASDWRQLQTHFEASLQAPWQDVMKQLKGFVFSSVLADLNQYALSGVIVSSSGHRFNLTEDISQLLVWDFYPWVLNRQKQSGQPMQQQDLIEFYERKQSRIDHLIRGALNKLHQCFLGHH